MTGLVVDQIASVAPALPWVRTLRLPGRAVRPWSDPDAELAVVSYETTGGADGVRAMWLDSGLTFDIGQEDGSALSVLAVGDGVAVVSHGCSQAFDPERARRSPVTSFDVVDLRTGTVTWSSPVPAEPRVTIICDVVWQSWSTSGSTADASAPPDVFRRIGDGAVVDGSDPSLMARIAAERAARWESDEARPRIHRLVEGQTSPSGSASCEVHPHASPSHRSDAVAKPSPTYRSHAVQHEPELHIWWPR